METSTQRSYLREFLRSRSGVAGVVLLVILLGASIYVVVAIPASINGQWEDAKAWTGYPQAAPPVWVNYLGVDAPQTMNVYLDKFSGNAGSSSAYSTTETFTWNSAVAPSNFILTPNFAGSAFELDLLWTKPDGNTVQITMSFPTSGDQYDINTAAVSQALTKYIQTQTDTFITSLTPTQELAALFSKDGAHILSNGVEEGTYTVTLQLLGDQSLSPKASQASLVGDSYGTMGTDSFGRPIDLGVLAGLPWALELGTIASVLSVVGGILWGGLAGFYGGWRDKLMSWGTLVILAVPGLSFIIAVSFTIQLTLLIEALLIAALSWPGFAIIARTVTLSIRSQTYIEADRAMGISSTRTFLTHILPRLTPVTIAFTALSVSGVIILAETLAFIGIEPGNIITWGGILNEAINADSSLHGWWWWTVFPGIMILVASLPFVLIGFAIDRIVAPRVSAK